MSFSHALRRTFSRQFFQVAQNLFYRDAGERSFHFGGYLYLVVYYFLKILANPSDGVLSVFRAPEHLVLLLAIPSVSKVASLFATSSFHFQLHVGTKSDDRTRP